MKTRLVNPFAIVVFVFSLAGTILVLHAIDHTPREPVAQEELYLSSPKVLRRLSLGYTGLLADIYWTRAVQYFGVQHHRGSGDFRLLSPLLEVTTELDPRLLPAYQFGANFLSPKPPMGAGLPGAALSLMKYGIEHNPNDWHLYYNLGFLYYTELKDYAKAADAFSQGAKLPQTNPLLSVLAARMAQHAGEFETARMLWSATYQSTKEPALRQNALNHLTALQVDEDVTYLEKAVEKYRNQTRSLPGSMNDLERAGLIRGTPTDPKGRPYKLLADGRIEVQDPNDIYFITKGLPPGATTPEPIRNDQSAFPAK